MMNKGFSTGVGLGLLVGSAVGMALPRRKMSHKRRVGRVIKTVGDVIENVSEAIGM